MKQHGVYRKINPAEPIDATEGYTRNIKHLHRIPLKSENAGLLVRNLEPKKIKTLKPDRKTQLYDAVLNYLQDRGATTGGTTSQQLIRDAHRSSNLLTAGQQHLNQQANLKAKKTQAVADALTQTETRPISQVEVSPSGDVEESGLGDGSGDVIQTPEKLPKDEPEDVPPSPWSEIKVSRKLSLETIGKRIYNRNWKTTAKQNKQIMSVVNQILNFIDVSYKSYDVDFSGLMYLFLQAPKDDRLKLKGSDSSMENNRDFMDKILSMLFELDKKAKGNEIKKMAQYLLKVVETNTKTAGRTEDWAPYNLEELEAYGGDADA